MFSRMKWVKNWKLTNFRGLDKQQVRFDRKKIMKNSEKKTLKNVKTENRSKQNLRSSIPRICPLFHDDVVGKNIISTCSSC